MIRAESLTRTYAVDGQRVHALSGVSLSIEKGELLAVAGPSGSGKTTFLNLVGGLDRPTSGSVVFEGRRLEALSLAELSRLRRARIGFVFQSYNLLPVLTARENVELGLALRRFPAADRSRLADEMLAQVGLAGLEDRRPAQLSGGQQQRVAVARAVAGSPALVIADEPTANLDSASAEELLDKFDRLNRELGATILFSSHDPRVLERARRVVTFRDGRVESDSGAPPAQDAPRP